MSIIRSNIARQLLAEGGAPRKPFSNGGFDEADVEAGLATESMSDFTSDNYGEDFQGSSFGSDVDDFGMDFVDSDEATPGGDVSFTPKGPGFIDKIGGGLDNMRDTLTRRGINRNMMSTRDAILASLPFGPRTDMNLFDIYQTMMDPKQAIFSEGLTGTRLNMDRAKQTFDKLEKEGVDVTKDIGPQLDNLTQAQISNIFNMNRTKSPGDDMPILPRLPRIAQVPSDVEQQKSDLGEYIASIRGANPNAFNIPERFRLAEGGEPRQEYGLGSIVKKITGTVKKVVKSDLGKAALGAAALYYAPGFGIKAQGGFAPFFSGLSSGLGFDKIPGGGVTAGIVGASLLGGLLASKEPEQDINALSQRISDQTGIDVAKIRGEVQQAYQNKDTSTLAQKYPFLVDQEYSASFSGGGDVKEVEKEKPMSPEEYFKSKQKFNKKKMLEDMENEYKEYLDRQKYGPRNEAAIGGDIEDTPKKEGIMMASAILGDESDDIAMQLFGRPVKELNPDEFKELMDYLNDLQKSFRAEGGRIGAQEGGMMNLGGNEMDLRGGGFVPIGVAEKADDVPARLSKNEFVFTADAVRAAGGGSVDRGADLMYKTMKQLENKVV